jgi:hypothetical protein
VTAAELDAVIARFRAGGRVEYANYHAGERVTWWHEADTDLFVERTQHAWSDGGGEQETRHTEAALRERIAALPFEDWSG